MPPKLPSQPQPDRNDFVSSRRDANASQHGRELHLETPEPLGGLGQHRDPAVAVELPGGLEILHLFLIARVVGIERREHHLVRIRAGGIAVEPQTGDPNDERIAGPRAFDIERAGERIASRRAMHARGVDAPGIDGGGVHGVTRLDGQHGFDA